MNRDSGGACPSWCRHHRRVEPGGAAPHESLRQVAAAEVDGVSVDLLVSAALRDGVGHGVVIRTGGVVIDLSAAQAKRLCTLITAAAALP